MVTAPTSERGYVVDSGPGRSNWWLSSSEFEQVPELRWPLSIDVYDRMRRGDAQVASVLRAVTLPVLRTPWRLDPAGAREEVVTQIADDLGLPVVGAEAGARARTKDRFAWSEHLRLALLMLPFGSIFFEQVARIDDAGRARLRKLGPRLPRTITAINVGEDGGLISIEQAGPASKVVIPVDRLVAYVHQREGGNWFGSSILRPAYKHWIIKDRLLRLQAQTIDRNGMGIPLYVGAEDETDLSGGASLAEAWRSGSNSGAAIPNGASLNLLGVQGELPDAEPAIRYHDEQIARAVLAHFLNLGTQTGSWALGSTFADFFTLSLQAVAEQVRDVTNSHVVEDLVDWNWGPDEPAPRVVFDEIGSHQAPTAQAIAALVQAGVIQPDRVTEEFVRQVLGLPPKGFPAPTTAP